MITALITGATSGIGRAVALSEAGYEIDAPRPSEVALEELRAAHPGITPIAVNVTDREALAAFVAGLRQEALRVAGR